MDLAGCPAAKGMPTLAGDGEGEGGKGGSNRSSHINSGQLSQPASQPLQPLLLPAFSWPPPPQDGIFWAQKTWHHQGGKSCAKEEEAFGKWLLRRIANFLSRGEQKKKEGDTDECAKEKKVLEMETELYLLNQTRCHLTHFPRGEIPYQFPTIYTHKAEVTDVAGGRMSIGYYHLVDNKMHTQSGG